MRSGLKKKKQSGFFFNKLFKKSFFIQKMEILPWRQPPDEHGILQVDEKTPTDSTQSWWFEAPFLMGVCVCVRPTCSSQELIHIVEGIFLLTDGYGSHNNPRRAWFFYTVQVPFQHTEQSGNAPYSQSASSLRDSRIVVFQRQLLKILNIFLQNSYFRVRYDKTFL